MEINANDIVVIPEHITVPKDFPHDFHKMKFLLTPSIVSSHRGFNMNTQTLEPSSNTKSKGVVQTLFELLGLKKDIDVGKDIFFRHVRIMNPETGEYYHNRGATILVDLRAAEGRFLFSLAVCNYKDNFNKLIAHRVCKERLESGQVFEIINYDPSLSVLQNIYLAVGVMEDEYPLTDLNWQDILPELYGTYTGEQRESLSTLRRLIRNKAQEN